MKGILKKISIIVDIIAGSVFGISMLLFLIKGDYLLATFCAVLFSFCYAELRYKELLLRIGEKK